MGGQPSKDKSLYQLVGRGDIQGIRDLHRAGAGLRWTDAGGKTSLILACSRPHLLPVAQALIDLGADVNAYEPGWPAGTALHQAAKRGLVQTVDLLLSRGARPLLRDIFLRSPLDLAREGEHVAVVRSIESHSCLFSGWFRKRLDKKLVLSMFSVVPYWVPTSKIWVVVLPSSDHRSPTDSNNLKLAIYHNMQVAQPCTVISLKRYRILEPDLSQQDPVLVLDHKFTKKAIKFIASEEGEERRLRLLYQACRGLPIDSTDLATPDPPPHLGGTAFTAPAAPAAETVPVPMPDDAELAMAIEASIQTALQEGIPDIVRLSDDVVGCDQMQHPSSVGDGLSVGRLRDPVAGSSALVPIGEGHGKGASSSNSCVICADATAVAACVPCGHMAGCVPCMNEIKAKKWGCPVCRATIDQVVRIYSVS